MLIRNTNYKVKNQNERKYEEKIFKILSIS